MKYLYTHSINNVVFYVGYGGKERPYNESCRNNKWFDFVELNDGIYDVNIIAEFEEKDDALNEEYKLIKLLAPSCNIKDVDNKMEKLKTRQFTLTADLQEQIMDAALKNGRNFSSEVRFALTEYYKDLRKKK